MKNLIESTLAIHTAKKILSEYIITEKDLKDFGLDLESFNLAKSLITFEDISEPEKEIRLCSAGDCRETVQKVVNFFETIGFNIKPEITEGEINHYVLSTKYKHWDLSFFKQSEVNKELAGSKLSNAILLLKNYAGDYSESDFNKYIELLSFYGETKEIKALKSAYAVSHTFKDWKGLNAAKIQSEYFDGYYKGDSAEDYFYSYEWYFEKNDSSYKDLFQPGCLVISYTEKLTGATSGTKIEIPKFMKMNNRDFENFVNECIFYDASLEEQRNELSEQDRE